MAKIIVLFGSLFLNFVLADDKKAVKESIEGERPEYFISKKYKNGSFLIYDCKKRHFACVNKLSFESCKEERKNAFKKRYRFLPCAPLKDLKSQNVCYKKQLELIESIPNKKFCINFGKRLLN